VWNRSWSRVSREYMSEAERAVNGVAKPIGEIDDDDEANMTTEEYEVSLSITSHSIKADQTGIRRCNGIRININQHKHSHHIVQYAFPHGMTSKFAVCPSLAHNSQSQFLQHQNMSRVHSHSAVFPLRERMQR
jgi:hypothetical protein